MYVFIFGCAGSLLLLGLFSSCGKKGLLFLAVRRFLVEVTSLVKHGLRTTGSAVVGLVAPGHMGSSWIRDRTGVPCIARQILHHWTTRKPWDNHF